MTSANAADCVDTGAEGTAVEAVDCWMRVTCAALADAVDSEAWAPER
jgi:hypothetical protein